jgi:hypothetical protein
MTDLYKASSVGPSPRGASRDWSEGGDEEQPRRSRPRPIVVSDPKPVAPAVVAPPQAPPDSVVVIRGNTKTVEVVGNGSRAGAAAQNQ